MRYYDAYNAYLSVSSTPTGYFSTLQTKVLNDQFSNSPFYRQITIDATPTDVRIFTGDKYNERTLLFRPSTIVNMGAYATWDGQTWLVFEYFQNEIYPKAKVQVCTDNLKWKDKGGTIHTYACAVNRGRGTLSASTGGTFDIELPTGYMMVDVQLNADTKTLVLSQRFVLNGRLYKIQGIDNLTQMLNGHGNLRMTMVPDTVENKFDDFANGIADNSVVYGLSAAGTINNPPPSGGKLW